LTYTIFLDDRLIGPKNELLRGRCKSRKACYWQILMGSIYILLEELLGLGYIRF
jgi:hypothetical protein